MISGEKKDLIRRLSLEGYTRRQIREMAGVSHGVVVKVLGYKGDGRLTKRNFRCPQCGSIINQLPCLRCSLSSADE